MLLLAAGCSTGEYERDYRARLATYRREAQFVDFNRDPTAIGESGLRLRLPKAFGRAASPAGTKERPRPLFIRGIPGVVAAYEAEASVEGQSVPGVVAIGFQPEGRSGQIEEAILRQVAADPALARQKLTWQKRDLETEGAEFPTWSVLQFKADELLPGGGSPPKKFPGRAEIWVSAGPRQAAVVVLAWLVPEQASAALPLGTLAGLTAQTVAVAAGEEPAAQPGGKPAAGKPAEPRPAAKP